MASVQKGTVGVVWSIDTTLTGTGIGTYTIQSTDYSLEGDEKKLRGTDGVTVNRTFFDTLEKFDLEVVPSGTTVALAVAANILPTRGADVILTGAKDTETT